MKRCRLCQRDKVRGDFPRHGLVCHACRAARERERRRTNGEHVRALERARSPAKVAANRRRRHRGRVSPPHRWIPLRMALALTGLSYTGLRAHIDAGRVARMVYLKRVYLDPAGIERIVKGGFR